PRLGAADDHLVTLLGQAEDWIHAVQRFGSVADGHEDPTSPFRLIGVLGTSAGGQHSKGRRAGSQQGVHLSAADREPAVVHRVTPVDELRAETKLALCQRRFCWLPRKRVL